MQQTSLLFLRKTSHPLAAKTLTIVLSIGAHYLIASNLGIFGSFTPLKLKSGGGTVKVVSLTPAEQARVPEAVKSNPLPIDQNPLNPAPATRNFSGFSAIPTIPAVPPTNRTANPTSPTSKPSSAQPRPDTTMAPSNNPSSPSSAPSSRPTPTKSTPRRSSSDPFDRNNQFSTMPRDPRSDGNLKPTKKPVPDRSNSSSGGTRPNSSPGTNSGSSSTPTPSPLPSSPTPTSDRPNIDKSFEAKVSITTNALRSQYPNQQIVAEKLPVVVGNRSAVTSKLGGATKYFEMAYIYGNEEDEHIGRIPADPSILALLGPQQATDLSEASERKTREAYQKRRRENPNGTKGKIFIYRVSFKISSQ